MRLRSLRHSSLFLCAALLLGACNQQEDEVIVDGDTFVLTSAGRLLTVDLSSGAVRTGNTLRGAENGETLVAMTIRIGGEVYVLGSSGRLYTANTLSGTLTLRTTLVADSTDTTNPYTALAGNNFAIDFNTVPDRLRVVSDTGQNLRVNVDTGAVTTDADLSAAAAPATGITAVAYSNDFGAACRSTIYYIDTTTDRLMTSSDPNGGVVTAVGNLGVDASAASSLTIVTAADSSNTAIAALNVGGTQNLYLINLTTGALTGARAVTGLPAGVTIRGIALLPLSIVPLQPAGDLTALSESNLLFSVRSDAPQKACTAALVSGLQAGELLVGIDLRPADGLIYAVGTTGRLYSVDPATGVATLEATLAADAADVSAPFTVLSGASFGIDVNPAADRLRVVSDTGQNLRINMDSGATTTDTELNPAGSAVGGAAYTNSIAGAGTTTLYALDATLDRLAIQGQPSGSPNNGDLLAVGALGVDVATIGGFEISARTGVAFAAMSTGALTTSNLYRIDLATGAATLVSAIAGNERVRGMTASTNVVATLYGVTSDARLVSFKPATPGTFDASVAITGLAVGETIIGLDRRPADGRLYAVTDAGRLYTLSSGGVATAGPLLSGGSLGVSLGGSLFGVDFNPTVDRLRIVSDSGANLRINVDTGVFVATDANLNPGVPNVVAAAYTRSIAGATSTTLYVLDLAANSLSIQAPPNDGTLTPVGVLDAAANFSDASFDIAGPQDGLVFAVLTPVGALQSSLYRINLSSGAATALGSLGPSGAPAMKAFVIDLQ